jgi:hypothetical protein
MQDIRINYQSEVECVFNFMSHLLLLVQAFLETLYLLVQHRVHF